MNLVFFAHPNFLGQQSMPRFANLLANGMQERGHNVAIWYPTENASRFKIPGVSSKWLGYVDQYILFPFEIRKRIKQCPSDTLFVFTDNALGPWVPFARNRPHVIHCHDFLAQRSALWEIAENPTSWTGRRYQAYIRRGYSQGRHFISVSKQTQADLHRILPFNPLTSTVIYNGFNRSFAPNCAYESKLTLGKVLSLDLSMGYLLHVGSNQWYKNRKGVIDLYDAWAADYGCSLPLVMIGTKPNASLLERWRESPFKDRIHFKSGLEDDIVQHAYVGASCLVFPSLAEGFGWPIVEAMACKCPVITTNESPMTEVGGDAALYIRKRPDKEVIKWAHEAAKTIQKVLSMSIKDREEVVNNGLINCKRFDTTKMLNLIEGNYQAILFQEGKRIQPKV